MGREPKTLNRGGTQRSCPEPNGTSQSRLWEAQLRLLFLERTGRSECCSPGFCFTCSSSGPLLSSGGRRTQVRTAEQQPPPRKAGSEGQLDRFNRTEMAPFFLVFAKEPPWSSSSYPRAFFTLGQGSETLWHW